MIFPETKASLARLRKAFRDCLALWLLTLAFRISPDECGDYIYSAMKRVRAEP
jgi:hypothetical protein